MMEPLSTSPITDWTSMLIIIGIAVVMILIVIKICKLQELQEKKKDE